jgi:hypothetical protein
MSQHNGNYEVFYFNWLTNRRFFIWKDRFLVSELMCFIVESDWLVSLMMGYFVGEKYQAPPFRDVVNLNIK